MDFIKIERSVFETLVSTLKNCHESLLTAISQLSHTPRDKWIDNE